MGLNCCRGGWRWSVLDNFKFITHRPRDHVPMRQPVEVAVGVTQVDGRGAQNIVAVQAESDLKVNRDSQPLNVICGGHVVAGCFFYASLVKCQLIHHSVEITDQWRGLACMSGQHNGLIPLTGERKSHAIQWMRHRKKAFGASHSPGFSVDTVKIE